VALRSNVGQALLTNEVSRSHTTTRHTIHITHNRQTSMPPAGFEPTISAGERPLGPAIIKLIIITIIIKLTQYKLIIAPKINNELCN
jgi:hypothetical protein